MYKYYSILTIILLSFFSSYSQSDFKVIVKGLKATDSASVSIQKGSKNLFTKIVKDSNSEDVSVVFSGDSALNNGKWALSIDATGYTYPTSKIINIPEDVNATITLTAMLNDGIYSYKWSDDDSAAGHNTQSYYGEPTSIKVLDKTVKVPNDYSSINLRNKYGIILSNDIEPWSKEDSYRLYKTLSEINMYGIEVGPVDFGSGKNIRGIFKLTKDEQYRDITLESDGDLVNATITQKAFVYAYPQIVTIDGIKGKFYSKRLYHSLINYFTDFGNNENVVNDIALRSFGVEFMKPNQTTEDLMGEDSSNFQNFTSLEKIEILSMFEELPDGFQKQEGLKYLVRRINGQTNPAYVNAAAIAWTGLKTIEFMSKAFIGGDLFDIRRLILHEKAHFLWAYTFDEKTKLDWIEIGGWFEDPTSGSGWSTYNTTESVSAYAHSKNPNEDMAESIAFYLTNPDKLLSVSVKKYEFIRDRIMHGTRYIAQIREDLTFTVYNLFPDYTFPGKIVSIDIEITGEPCGEKTMKMTAKLNSDNFPIDTAASAYVRMVSTIGTINDIGLQPRNGGQDSILVGQTKFNKYQKAGYWTLQGFTTWDKAGNQRYENTSTIGFKVFINNICEDITPPKWNYDLKMEKIEGKFTKGDFNTYPDENGVDGQAIKISASVYDDTKMTNLTHRMINPTIDPISGDESSNVSGSFLYERQVGSSPLIDEEKGYANEHNSDKFYETYVAIPDYFPSGYYSLSQSDFYDIARNGSVVRYVKDTSDYYIAPKYRNNSFKDVRDSIYVKTPYPDYIAPEIDKTNIIVSAEPTKPEAPDGETRVEFIVLARDLSDFPGHEAGLSRLSVTLRGPQGQKAGGQTGNSTMNHPELDKTRSFPGPDGNSDWKAYDFNLTLPPGTAAGKWGIEQIITQDKAGNKKAYSFVEYVRFDVIESDTKLTTPLHVEITDKHINAKNVDSITAKMSCVPCKDLNYVYTIYSRTGGGGAVVRGEGKFSSDSIIVKNIKTTGLLDGLVNLTVQVTDSTSALVATKSTQYTKDVVYPKAYYSKSNLQDQGWSNIDDITIDIEVEQIDIGGIYNYEISNSSGKTGITQDNFNNFKTYSTSNSNEIVKYSGSISSGSTQLDNLNFSSLNDGYIKTILTITDQVGNIGNQEITYYFKRNNELKLIGSEIIDTDNDKFGDDIDNCPSNANEDQADMDGDGIGDVCDDDKDGDTKLNTEDNCPETANKDQADMDGDGIGDVCDDDKDGDTKLNTEDNCPETANEDQADMDEDGIGDVCDDDKDGDTKLNTEDNCPETANEDQADFDSDGVGDVCDNDVDGDGIFNVDDSCSDTPIGSVINAAGCVFFSLPENNNNILITSSTCVGSNNGSLELVIKDTNYNYSITISGEDNPILITGNNTTASVNGLGAGNYMVCFTVDGKNDYEQCFEVNIGEPKALSAFIDVDNDNRTTSIQLSGSSSYNVEVNGQRFDVKGDKFTTNLPSGLSIIKISTDLDCQGVIKREIFISEDILYYPNPTQGDVNVYVNGEDSKVMMSVFSSKGDLIFTKEQDIQTSRKTDLDLGGVPAGTYLITLDGLTVRKTFKIVKR